MAKETLKTYREILGFEPHNEKGLDCSKDPKIVEASHAEDCDINVLLARYEKTGQFPETPANIDQAFGDFSNIPDLQGVMEAAQQAEEAFMELPAKVRAKFDHDPAKLWDYLHNPENMEESYKLGLREKKKAEPITQSGVSVGTVTSSKDKPGSSEPAQ